MSVSIRSITLSGYAYLTSLQERLFARTKMLQNRYVIAHTYDRTSVCWNRNATEQMSSSTEMLQNKETGKSCKASECYSTCYVKYDR